MWQPVGGLPQFGNHSSGQFAGLQPVEEHPKSPESLYRSRKERGDGGRGGKCAAVFEGTGKRHLVLPVMGFVDAVLCCEL